MLTCQKEHFDIPSEITYLNGAYMSPKHDKVVAAGIEGVKRMSQPFNIYPEDFYNQVEEVKKTYAQLVGIPDAERVAIIPSVSYGIANVTKNLKPKFYM